MQVEPYNFLRNENCWKKSLNKPKIDKIKIDRWEKMAGTNGILSCFEFEVVPAVLSRLYLFLLSSLLVELSSPITVLDLIL